MKHTVGNITSTQRRVVYFLIFANADLTNTQTAFANSDHEDHTQVVTVAGRDVLKGKRSTSEKGALKMLSEHNDGPDRKWGTRKAQIALGWSCGNGDWELVCHPSWTHFALGV